MFWYSNTRSIFKSSIAKKNPCQHIPGRMGRWKGRKLEVSQNSRITPRGVVFFSSARLRKKRWKKTPPPWGLFRETPVVLRRVCLLNSFGQMSVLGIVLLLVYFFKWFCDGTRPDSMGVLFALKHAQDTRSKS